MCVNDERTKKLKRESKTVFVTETVIELLARQ